MIAAALLAGKPLVSGTTGISRADMETLEAASTKIPLLHTRNFSVGITVLTSLVEQAAAILGAGYDAEIVEMHHRQKKMRRREPRACWQRPWRKGRKRI